MNARAEASLRHLHFDVVDSTMESAREAVAAFPDSALLLVTAAGQRTGRGTRGRPWHSPPGNVYLTLAVSRALLPPARLALFPLEAGVALWDAVAGLLAPTARPRLHLKWPNDLLLDGRKTAGMLLEATTEHLFAGIGLNIRTAPEVTDGGTPSARLADAGLAEEHGLEAATAFGTVLRDRLAAPAGPHHAADVVAAWKLRALWGRPHRLRDRPGRPEVFPVDLDADGHLRVRHADGREEWLVSDYLA